MLRSSLGWIFDNYCLLTEFAFRTVKCLVVRTELVRSVRKDRGLNILPYENQGQSINSSAYATVNI